MPLLDELALEFDDARPVIPGLIDRGILSPKVEEIIVDIQDKLRSMASERTMWSKPALITAPWQELRALANDALRLLPSTSTGS
ncbi:MAG TPA: hypothetical protein VG293_11100 [Solirubrobacteraceae bacterium]|nr:hypothetical protein [Solirubrobacteraceae bacterium]